MLTARVKHIFALVLILIFLIASFTKEIDAVSSCTANVSPSTVQANAVEADFTFSITNTGSNNIVYIKIDVPSSNFSLSNYGVPGWSVGASSQSAELTGGTITPGSTANIGFKVSVGSSEAPAADWTIATYDGSQLVNCTGNLGTSISGVADVLAPQLSDPSVTSITSSSVTISWTTNEPSTSTVYYGITNSYGAENGNSSLTTSHSVTLINLAANTTYYYGVASTDTSGNTGRVDENLFTTAAAGLVSSTATPVATSTPTATPTTTTTTATATPRPSDSTAPVVSITTDLDVSYEVAPLIEGSARDNESLSSIEYSTDGGLNWLPVDPTSLSELRGAGFIESTFSFMPKVIEDNNYEIIARAIDARGNIGESDVVTLVIDRLPPSVGGNMLSLGPQPLLPNENGVIITMAGLEQRMTLSAVGGPISVDLIVGSSISSLGRSAETGLWTGAINIKEPGIYQLKTKAIDGAGNVTERLLNTIGVVEPGKIVDEDTDIPVKSGEVYLYSKDPLTHLWHLWDAKTFGQQNPIKINENGNYQYFLPPGTYYLQIKTPRHATLTSKIFTLSQSTPFNADFKVNTKNTLNLGSFVFKLPDLFAKKAAVELTIPQFESSEDNLIGQEHPVFNLPTTDDDILESRSLRGEPHILSFISTWSPPSVEQVATIEEEILREDLPVQFISTQEASAKVKIFLARGNYDVDVLVDPDGTLVEDFGLQTLPSHYIVNQEGEVERIVTGVLTAEQVRNILDNL